MLSQTKIAVAMPEADLELLAAVGEVIYPEEHDVLFEQGQRGDYLYVIIDGDIHLFTEGPNEQVVWLGPGDFFGEIGFILATPRTKTAKAVSDRCVLWRVHRSVLWSYNECEPVMMLGRLLVALSPYIQIRLNKLVVGDELPADLLENHCDSDHTAIQNLAAELRRDNEWDTAIATWSYMRQMPYRFCTWQQKASETLRLGYGTCTTKSNLQVALLRANGIEAGVSEVYAPSAMLLDLMPAGYRYRSKSMIRHYYAAAKLDGQWVPCEANYTPQVLGYAGQTYPILKQFNARQLERGTPLNLANEAMGLDPYEMNILPDLSDVMKKRSYYDDDQAGGMNVILDKVQGYLSPMPAWAESTLQLIEQQPKEGFRQAYANLTSDLHYLHSVIQYPGHL